MVYDDQSDYYSAEATEWLSPQERERIKEKQRLAKIKEEEMKGKVMVSVDLAGRRVLSEEVEEEEPQNRGPAGRGLSTGFLTNAGQDLCLCSLLIINCSFLLNPLAP